MKKLILNVCIGLLLFCGSTCAQEIVLDSKNNRFLINEKSAKPRLDIIVQSFTDYERNVLSRSAVMDTVTKPTFEKVSEKEYNVTAGRMGEKLTFVIRNFEKLDVGYSVSRDPVMHKGDTLILRPDKDLFYILNREQTIPMTDMPIGMSQIKISLQDKHKNILFKLNIRYSYPKPELIYVDLTNDYGGGVLEDTNKIRRIVHRVNQVPTVYSHNNSVPDHIVTNYSNLFFGFKKAYYDGKIQPSTVYCKIDNRFWSVTQPETYPFTDAKTLAREDDWYILPSGKHTIIAGYAIAAGKYEQYEFELNKKSLETWPHYLTKAGFFIVMILFSKPWILLILLGLILFSKWGSRMKRQREAAQKTNLELQTIQSQLNPHFVFNALGSVQGLINKNEIEKANSYLTDFSKLLRNSLDNSGKDLVPLSVELRNMDNYIKLEQLRFNFHYEMVVDEDIESSQVEIPSLLVQPLVENAIKHGISSLAERGLLRILFRREKNDLVVEIIDNGKGFDFKMPLNGKGINLTRERIKLLNKQRHKIEMDFVVDGDGGTVARVTFKNTL